MLQQLVVIKGAKGFEEDINSFKRYSVCIKRFGLKLNETYQEYSLKFNSQKS